MFWFIAGALVGVGAALVAVPLWRGALALGRGRGRLRYGLAGAFVATFAGAAAIIYIAIGSRHSLGSRPAAAAMVAPGGESACDTAKRVARWMLWISAAIYVLGFLVAFALGPLLSRLDQ